MTLEIRPNCEGCDKDLPPDAPEAMICSYECTWCAECVTRLCNVCPNCGGGFTPRPVRPRAEWRPGMSLLLRPASSTRIAMTCSWDEAERFAVRLADLSPRDR